MKNFILGILTGVLASAFGSFLSFYLTNRADARKKDAEDDAVFEAFKEEIVNNFEMVSANCVELENELALLPDQHTLTNLTPLYFSTWDLLKTHIPEQLSDKEVLRKLSLSMHFVLLVNGQIESREQYKLNNGSMSNFSDVVKKRDENLLIYHARLLTRIIELQDTLNLQIHFKSPSRTLMKAVKDVSRTK